MPQRRTVQINRQKRMSNSTLQITFPGNITSEDVCGQRFHKEVEYSTKKKKRWNIIEELLNMENINEKPFKLKVSQSIIRDKKVIFYRDSVSGKNFGHVESKNGGNNLDPGKLWTEKGLNETILRAGTNQCEKKKHSPKSRKHHNSEPTQKKIDKKLEARERRFSEIDKRRHCVEVNECIPLSSMKRKSKSFGFILQKERDLINRKLKIRREIEYNMYSEGKEYLEENLNGDDTSSDSMEVAEDNEVLFKCDAELNGGLRVEDCIVNLDAVKRTDRNRNRNKKKHQIWKGEDRQDWQIVDFTDDDSEESMVSVLDLSQKYEGIVWEREMEKTEWENELEIILDEGWKPWCSNTVPVTMLFLLPGESMLLLKSRETPDRGVELTVQMGGTCDGLDKSGGDLRKIVDRLKQQQQKQLQPDIDRNKDGDSSNSTAELLQLAGPSSTFTNAASTQPLLSPNGFPPISSQLYSDWLSSMHKEWSLCGRTVCVSERSKEVLDQEECVVCLCSALDIGAGMTTVMSGCGHMCCQECLSCHVISRLQLGLNEMLCPGYQCQVPLTAPTVLALVGLAQYTRLRLPQLHRAVLHERGRRCRACRAVLLLLQSDTGPARYVCSCQRLVCGLCGFDVHWPTSCSEDARNRKTLLRLGDWGIVPELPQECIVVGRHCPSCSEFIERHGGCNHISCRCGSHFCWLCGDIMANHGNSFPCLTGSTRHWHSANQLISHDLSRLDVAPTPDSVRSIFYCRSVFYRLQNHRLIYETMAWRIHRICHYSGEFENIHMIQSHMLEVTAAISNIYAKLTCCLERRSQFRTLYCVLAETLIYHRRIILHSLDLPNHKLPPHNAKAVMNRLNNTVRQSQLFLRYCHRTIH